MLKKTLKFKILNHERRRQRMLKHLIPTEDLSIVPDPASVEDTVIRRNTPSPLLRAKEILPEEYFYFLTRITLEHASHAEMAKELGITVWASSKRLSRIRDKLDKEFPGYRK